jgi:hypothetical protein
MEKNCLDRLKPKDKVRCIESDSYPLGNKFNEVIPGKKYTVNEVDGTQYLNAGVILIKENPGIYYISSFELLGQRRFVFKFDTD